MDLETGLYHDNPEFDDVVDKLSNDLFQISSTNGQVSELLRRESRAVQSGGEAPRSTSVEQMALVQQNQQLFRELKSEIEEMQQWTDPSPSQKYSQHKIAADFGKLFVEFKRIQELVIENAKAASKDGGSHKRGGKTSSRSLHSTIELEGESQANQTAVEPDLEADEDQELLPEQTLAFEDQLAQDEVSYQQGLVSEREQEIENVAQGMNELNEIYMNLGTIVREQGVSLDNIESNLFNMSTNVRNGSSQLNKAHRSQRRSSGRMCCFLIILLIMAAFIILSVSLS